MHIIIILYTNMPFDFHVIKSNDPTTYCRPAESSRLYRIPVFLNLFTVPTTFSIF